MTALQKLLEAQLLINQAIDMMRPRPYNQTKDMFDELSFMKSVILAAPNRPIRSTTEIMQDIESKTGRKLTLRQAGMYLRRLGCKRESYRVGAKTGRGYRVEIKHHENS